MKKLLFTNSTKFFSSIVFLISLISIHLAYADEGDLDPTFGDGGVVMTNLDYKIPTEDIGKGVAIQSDGKIIMVGYSDQITTDNDFTITRYNTDGSLDESFGNNGIVKTDYTSSYDRAFDVAIQGDGKIIVVGETLHSHYFIAMARYNTDGSLDENFGTNGLVTTGVTSAQGRSILIQEDGKIVVAGSVYSYGAAIVRYNPNGTLDTDFGVGGFASANDLIIANGLSIQDDGKYIITGRRSANYGPAYFSTARFNNDGSLDDSFGTGGIVHTIAGFYAEAFNLAVQDNGKIVVVGYSTIRVTSDNEFTIIRYNTDGSPDSTFGTDGIIRTDLSDGDEWAYDVCIQDDEKIIVGGSAHNKEDYALTRYNSDGSLDVSFGTDGISIENFGCTSIKCYEEAQAMTIQDDGKIIVAGYSLSANTGSKDFNVARYLTDGNLDLDFGNNGSAMTDIGRFVPGDDYGYNLTIIQNDGKIIVVGSSSQLGIDPKSKDMVTLLRYYPDGSLDESFGIDGIVMTNFGTTAALAYSVAIQEDNKIIIAGGCLPVNSIFLFAVARFDMDGNLDEDFGDNGLVTTDFELSGSGANLARSIIIQNDGKIIAAGYSIENNLYDFALARYNEDGSLDETFSDDGMVTTSVSPEGAEIIFDLVIQDDGKIIACGDSDREAILVRYNEDGSIDNTFGTEGIVNAGFGPYGGASGIEIQDDGKILVCGSTMIHSWTYYDFAVARINPDGSFDNGFGTDGVVKTDLRWAVGDYNNPASDNAYDLVLQSDDKIVVVGMGYSYWGDFVLVRYDPNGDLDPDFGTNGVVISQLSGRYDWAASVALQNDGKILAAGMAYSGNSNTGDIVLARYEAFTNLPPVAICQDLSLTVDENCEAWATAEDIDNGSYDPNGDQITLSLDPAGPFVPGETTVTLTVTDEFGESDQCTATITVTDNTPPVINTVPVEMDFTIWPPNHSYETFLLSDFISSVEDNCAEPEVDDVNITMATSDEPEDAEGDGDGNTLNDIVIASDCKSVQLRKERDGGGNGRVYTIYFELEDDNNTTTVTCQVQVPHNNGEEAIDDGAVYQVDGNCENKSIYLSDFGNNLELMVYPNPFSGLTTIEYMLNQPGTTRIIFYNQFGKPVDMIEESQQSGLNKVIWIPGKLAEGIYFIRLVAGDMSASEKVLLVK